MIWVSDKLFENIEADKSSIIIKYKFCKIEHLTHSMGLDEKLSNPMNDYFKKYQKELDFSCNVKGGRH